MLKKKKKKRKEASMATKERRKTPPGAPKYHRLTDEKRIIIEALRKEGCSKKHIAERVGCHPTLWTPYCRKLATFSPLLTKHK